MDRDLPASTSSPVETVDLVVDGTDHVWSTASFDALTRRDADSAQHPLDRA